MNLKEKIDWLNKECKNSLMITHMLKWQINSFADNTPLSMAKKYPYFESEDLEELIDTAIEFVKKNQNKLVVNGKTYKLVEEEL